MDGFKLGAYGKRGCHSFGVSSREDVTAGAIEEELHKISERNLLGVDLLEEMIVN